MDDIITFNGDALKNAILKANEPIVVPDEYKQTIIAVSNICSDYIELVKEILILCGKEDITKYIDNPTRKFRTVKDIYNEVWISNGECFLSVNGNLSYLDELELSEDDCELTPDLLELFIERIPLTVVAKLML